MHAPSALLAGAVLTFGAIAFTNLYLPPAVAPAQRTGAAATIEEASEHSAILDLKYQSGISAVEYRGLLVEPATDRVENTDAFQALDEPEEVVKAEAPVPPVTRQPAQADDAQKKPSSKAGASAPPRKKEVPARMAPQSKVGSTEPPPTLAPAPSSTVPGKALSTERASQPKAVTVSAISGQRAWVRIGDTRTLVVTLGDQVADIGRVKAIQEDSVEFENGEILKVSL